MIFCAPKRGDYSRETIISRPPSDPSFKYCSLSHALIILFKIKNKSHPLYWTEVVLSVPNLAPSWIINVNITSISLNLYWSVLLDRKKEMTRRVGWARLFEGGDYFEKRQLMLGRLLCEETGYSFGTLSFTKFWLTRSLVRESYI